MSTVFFLSTIHQLICESCKHPKMYLAFEFGDLEFQKQLLTQMYDFFIMRLVDQPGLDTRAYRLLDTAGRDISPSDHRSRLQASH